MRLARPLYSLASSTMALAPHRFHPVLMRPHHFPSFNRFFDDFMGDLASLDIGFPPYWADANNRLATFTGNELAQVTNDANKFAVSVDVSHYKPEELKVNLEGRVLTIEGNQEQTSDTGYTQRSFIRKWTLPEDVDVNALASSLSEKGHLSIEAPKKGAEAAPRAIPIVPKMTGDTSKKEITGDATKKQ